MINVKQAQQNTLEANGEIIKFIEKHINYASTNGQINTLINLGFLRKEYGIYRIANSLEFIRTNGFTVSVIRISKSKDIYDVGISWNF